MPAPILGLSNKALGGIKDGVSGVTTKVKGVMGGRGKLGVGDVATHWQKATFSLTDDQRKMVIQRQVRLERFRQLAVSPVPAQEADEAGPERGSSWHVVVP